MSELVVGVDGGNYEGKTVGPYGSDIYRTAVCDWFERNVEETFGADDMEFRIGDRKGFAGTIAQYEDAYGGAGMYGDSKAHEDTKIRILLAIHRYTNKYAPGVERVSLVTGQPISSHKKNEKERIQKMLKGTHNFEVNGEPQRLIIENVGVATEGGGAFWSAPEMGTVRIIDIGSGTVNACTIAERKFINQASDTFNFGRETTNKNDLEGFARGVIRQTTKLKWSRNDRVLVCGGSAELILPYLKAHYTHAELLQPQLQAGHSFYVLKPVFANAAGFYNLARNAFK